MGEAFRAKEFFFLYTTFETPPQPGAGAFKIIFSFKIYTKSDSQTNPFEFYLFPSQHVRSIWGLLDGARSFHTPTHTRAKQRSHTWHSLATRWWQPLLTRPAPLPTSRAQPQNGSVRAYTWYHLSARWCGPHITRAAPLPTSRT